jgi:hypothetical protein
MKTEISTTNASSHSTASATVPATTATIAATSRRGPIGARRAGPASPARCAATARRSRPNDQYRSEQKFIAAPAPSSSQYAGDGPSSGASTGNSATDSSRLPSRATWNRSQRRRSGTADAVSRGRHVSTRLARKFSCSVRTACSAFATPAAIPSPSRPSSNSCPTTATETPTRAKSRSSRRTDLNDAVRDRVFSSWTYGHRGAHHGCSLRAARHPGARPTRRSPTPRPAAVRFHDSRQRSPAYPLIYGNNLPAGG